MTFSDPESQFQGHSIVYKRRAVAAQTARSRCKVLSLQYVYAYYFRAYQRQKTLHGVGVITKLHFAILWHLRNHWSDLESRAEVIHWWQLNARVRL